jgi:lipid-A-disaccharide synthase-like uncharacterized protein
MKPGLIVAMIALLALGFWLARGPSIEGLRPGAETFSINLARSRGVIEVLNDPAGGPPTFRILLRDGFASPILSAEEFTALYGEPLYRELDTAGANWLFKALSITSWTSLAWITLGFAGQLAFFGRMFVQWLVSEKRGESQVPLSFWWMSLLGAVALFSYFIWRQDVVGVLGQSSGMVIYARNIHLIHKRRRGAADQPDGGPVANPAPAPGV